MQQYIMDDRIILSIQGLRFVKKRDHLYHGVKTDNAYGILWNYKGSDGFMDYPTEKERNKIFEEIKKLIKDREDKHGPNLS